MVAEKRQKRRVAKTAKHIPRGVREADLTALIRDAEQHPGKYAEAARLAWFHERQHLRKMRRPLQGRPISLPNAPSGGYVGGMLPSSAWFDGLWFGEEHVDQDGNRTYVLAPFPPGGDDSLMLRCRRCGTSTPPIAMSARGVCLDCQYAGMSDMQLPSSTSSINLGKVRSAIRRGEVLTEGGF